jgi:hypothetical protein
MLPCDGSLRPSVPPHTISRYPVTAPMGHQPLMPLGATNGGYGSLWKAFHSAPYG